MRIYEILFESLKLPLKRVKIFLLVLFFAIVFECGTYEVFQNPLGDWTLIISIAYTVFSLIIFGIILSLTNAAILEYKFEFDFKEHIIDSIKEYAITMYYLLISFLINSFFVFPINFYSDFLQIKELIFQKNFGEAILLMNEFIHQLPITMQINLTVYIPLKVLGMLIILILFSSLAFIGKALFIRSNDFKKAFDLRIIFSTIKKIGYLRYLIFLFLIVIIATVLINIILFLETYLADILISALLEVFVIFFVTNLFYLIIDDSI